MKEITEEAKAFYSLFWGFKGTYKQRNISGMNTSSLRNKQYTIKKFFATKYTTAYNCFLDRYIHRTQMYETPFRVFMCSTKANIFITLVNDYNIVNYGFTLSEWESAFPKGIPDTPKKFQRWISKMGLEAKYHFFFLAKKAVVATPVLAEVQDKLESLKSLYTDQELAQWVLSVCNWKQYLGT